MLVSAAVESRLRRNGPELAWLILLAVLALAMRLPGLAEPANNYDEGVYLQALLLLARGYEPFSEIAVSQGPLHLHAQLPFFLLFGQTVAAARAASVAYSLAALAGVWWIGRQLGGRRAGLAAAVLLAVSPTYLRFSRQALADLPALAPATLAVGAALAYRRTGRGRWLVGAGLLLGLGVLMKPIVLPAGLAVAALVWRPDRPGWRALGVVAGLVTAAALAVLLGLGPGPVSAQVLGFRAGARAAYGWSLEQNGALLVDKLDQEQLGFYALAAIGAGVAAAGPRRWPALAIALWAAATLGLLLAHSPLRYHHMVILLPPLAVLGGATVAAAPGLLRRGDARRRALGLLGAAAVLLYAAAAPELARRDALLLDNVDAAGAGSADVEDLLAAAERVRRLSRPEDFVLTDSPYVAFLADRRVPPELVDPSEARLRSGDLTDAEVATVAAAYAPEVVVLWQGRLSRLAGVTAWLGAEYQVERRFGTVDDGQPRAILRRRGA
jgi:4-amino-4-deoxy-L-arabinose transferase-like glycosyltransferase